MAHNENQLTEQQEQRFFEDEVRRIARQLWPEAQYQGSEIKDGRERDGVFQTEDCVHLVEATVSRSKTKAEDDAKKLASLAKRLQSRISDKAIKCWFVTKHEPTAEQREAVRKQSQSITSLSFAQFQSKLVDVMSYISLRSAYHFGSVRNPDTGEHLAENIKYISVDLTERESGQLWTINEIEEKLQHGARFMFLADYGAGKSMTLREVFLGLRTSYLKGNTVKFPIYINLRDHFGQTDPHEVLERHARIIGFSHPAHLVRAWRAGYVILLIDGFDELATLGIQGLWRRLHDLRYRAMEVVRRFIREQPSDIGVVLTGRAHFFDTDKERRDALGTNRQFVELRINEFNDTQIESYLKSRGLTGLVPRWMPSRPLLVGYLAASGVLQKTVMAEGGEGGAFSDDPAKGWNYVLDKICAREAEIEAGIDGQTVRRILERLATMARQGQSGLGPLTPENMISAFNEICGYQPDERGLVILQRLPGLGIDRAEEGTRAFLDEDFADICRAGDVFVYLRDPFGTTTAIFRGSDRTMGGLGIGLLITKAEEVGFPSGKMIPALRLATEAEDGCALLIDLVRATIEFGFPFEFTVQLRDVFIPYLELNEKMNDSSKLSFCECLFSRVAIDADVDPAKLPKFESCFIEEVEGRSSMTDLPDGIFDAKCAITHFSDTAATTSAISEMDLPLASRVLLTMLKKVYLQSGSGRKENALQRGLDHGSRRLVVPILKLLQAEGIVSRYRRAGLDMTIWVPDRSKTARIQRIITSPRTCNDPLLTKVEQIS